jgi:hypothetical protein
MLKRNLTFPMLLLTKMAFFHILGIAAASITQNPLSKAIQKG